MNTVVTSKEAILQTCRAFVSEHGLSALNMRAVAKKCNIALGSLYNYFPSKNDLTIAVIGSVWQDIFHMKGTCETERTFPDHVQWIFESVKAGMVEYPNFFTTHSVSFASTEKGQARQAMERYFVHMKSGLYEALQRDMAVRQDTFDETFSQDAFIDFVLTGLLTLLMQQRDSCTVLLEMVRRTIYGREPVFLNSLL